VSKKLPIEVIIPIFSYINFKIKVMFYKFNQDALEFEKVKTGSFVKAGLIVVAVVMLIGFGVAPRATVKNLTPEEKLIVVREYNDFSEAKLISKIKELNFRFPHIILAQSYQETGRFKSPIFKENHNLFGMKQAILRVNLAKGTNRGHAYYQNWQESVIDYALYYATYLSDIKTEGEYFEYLRQNYAEDSAYVDRLKALIKKRNLKAKFNG
jgi:hypothetical protein